MVCQCFELTIDPSQISFLQFILEAYEGVCTLTTLDSRAGRIRLFIPQGHQQTVAAVLLDLGLPVPVLMQA